MLSFFFFFFIMRNNIFYQKMNTTFWTIIGVAIALGSFIFKVDRARKKDREKFVLKEEYKEDKEENRREHDDIKKEIKEIREEIKEDIKEIKDEIKNKASKEDTERIYNMLAVLTEDVKNILKEIQK